MSPQVVPEAVAWGMSTRFGPRKFLPPEDAVIVPPRAFACQHYELCLVFVARQKWRSWACKGCPQCPDDARIEVLRPSREPGRGVLRATSKR